MRARTEDLLTLRDGEPIDALLRERLASNPENAREVERLSRIAEDLRRLPLLEPPAGAWQRIAAEASSQRRSRSARFVAAAAAIVAIAALLRVAPWRTDRPIDMPDVQAEPPSFAAPRELEAEPQSEPESDPSADYARLVAESARLELMLAALDRPPRLMNAGTALTIAGLEDYIVLVDEQLNYAEARDVDLRYREALWRERVDAMNALLHVRYAQARAPTY